MRRSLRCNRPLLLLAGACAALTLAGAAAAGDGTVSATVQAGSYELQSAAEGTTPWVEDFGRLNVPGKPDLPAKIFAIAIPPGTRVADVTFETGEGIESTAEGRAGSPAQSVHPDRFRDPGRQALEHRPRGLGGHVPRGQAGSPRRQEQVALTPIAQPHHLVGDRARLVGHDDALRDPVPSVGSPCLDQAAGHVVPFSGGHAVGDGDHRHPKRRVPAHRTSDPPS